MKITQVRTFEALEQYLREFNNFQGDQGTQYDFNGALSLFLAILDNLAKRHLAADLDYLEEIGWRFEPQQVRFLKARDRLM